MLASGTVGGACGADHGTTRVDTQPMFGNLGIAMAFATPASLPPKHPKTKAGEK